MKLIIIKMQVMSINMYNYIDISRLSYEKVDLKIVDLLLSKITK